MTDTLVRPEVADPELQDDDPIFTHIVKGTPDKSAQTLIVEARVLGYPIEALCGYTWVPTRDPEKHPLCERCVEIWTEMRHGN